MRKKLGTDVSFTIHLFNKEKKYQKYQEDSLKKYQQWQRGEERSGKNKKQLWIFFIKDVHQLEVLELFVCAFLLSCPSHHHHLHCSSLSHNPCAHLQSILWDLEVGEKSFSSFIPKEEERVKLIKWIKTFEEERSIINWVKDKD